MQDLLIAADADVKRVRAIIHDLGTGCNAAARHFRPAPGVIPVLCRTGATLSIISTMAVVLDRFYG